MKLKTALGTIMTLALILIISATNLKTTFAKQEIPISIGSRYREYELIQKFNNFDEPEHELKSVEFTPKDGGVKIFIDKEYNAFYINFIKKGKYNVKFTFTNGKSKVGVVNVADLVKDGKALKYEFEKDKKGNDILFIENMSNTDMPNVDIKLGKKINIKGIAIPGNRYTSYSFKKGFLKKNKFNTKDTNKIKYKVVGTGSIESPRIDRYKLKGDFVSEIKLGDGYHGHEGYITLLRIDDPGKDIYDASETIKVNKGNSNKWIKLREKFSVDNITYINIYLRVVE